MLRFDTLTTGPNIGKVTFSLDGKPVLTKKNPPYSVELDLGNIPRPRTLTAKAFDAAGAELASDEMVINSAANRFQVRLAEPLKGKRYQGSLLARADTDVPDGQTVERVEFFLNETRVATLYQPPWQQPIVLPKGEEIAYVRAVAFLTDGNSTENLVFVNAPDDLAEVNINFVELYTTVFDRQSRPVEGLEQKDFTVSEDGAKQEIARFDRVTDLPIHAAVTLDVSGSMEDSLDKARQSALEFFQQHHAAQGPGGRHHLQRPPEPDGEVHQRRAHPGRRPGRPQGRARHGALRQHHLHPLLLQRRQGAARRCSSSRTARTRGAASPGRTPSTTPGGPASPSTPSAWATWTRRS